MKREIKFRGKCAITGAWRYGWYYISNGNHIIRDEEDKESIVLETTVGQFTGLQDKDGNDIYEGDVITKDRYPFYDNDGEPNYVGVVTWVYSQWQYIFQCVNPKKSGISSGINEGLNDEGFDESQKTEMNVIGNIHDNPELIK